MREASVYRENSRLRPIQSKYLIQEEEEDEIIIFLFQILDLFLLLLLLF